MGFCTQCGYPNPGTFCSNCGTRQVPPAASTTSAAPPSTTAGRTSSPSASPGPAVSRSSPSTAKPTPSTGNCPHCNKPVSGKRTELQNGIKYHSQCFSCDGCGFDPGEVGGQIYWNAAESKMYCRTCYSFKPGSQPINARDFAS
jgi:hypothetical protein